ncbi:alpha/beta hydrolase [Enterovibrio norvegicus]|uniref:alpha/beta hydrolase n=1 Tax=Enterovibrio norvegicus TaxID=188144 RepID=UPI000C822F45|nr:alpha/beta hydrolase [Enterovibrio norvegicus]
MFDHDTPLMALTPTQPQMQSARPLQPQVQPTTAAPPKRQQAIRVFNRLVPIDGKPTNVAIWAPEKETAENADASAPSKPMRYYLTHKGDAVKARSIQAKSDIQVSKFCLIFPGFNGGPLDQFHLAEALAKAGYWVMSVGCYINPELKPSDDPDKIALALEDAYAAYPSILQTFTELTGLCISPETLSEVRYASFSAGIYPLLRAVRKGHCPQWQHRLLLMAPGLSATPGLAELLAQAPVSRMDLIHSEQDTHPTFGDPLHYLSFFDASHTQLHLLPKGEHYDFIHLPLSVTKDANATPTGGFTQSQHEHAVKQECLAVLDSLIHGETR